MAGNTKLLGFAPDGTVLLQRWGKKASVKLPAESIQILRDACYNDLPKKPAGQFIPITEFRAQYDERTGTIEIEVSAGAASKVAKALGIISFAHQHSVGDQKQNPESAEELKGWSARLEDLVAEHKRYLDTKDEPGVE